jgi:hypothetical protein
VTQWRATSANSGMDKKFPNFFIIYVRLLLKLNLGAKSGFKNAHLDPQRYDDLLSHSAAVLKKSANYKLAVADSYVDVPNSY